MPLDQTASPDPATVTAPDVATAHPGTERRALLRNAGLGAALFGVLGGGAAALRPGTADAATITDGDILNFALNLEYLEAEFYLRATTGAGLSPSEVTGTGTPGAATGGYAVPFSNPYLKALAEDIAADEHEHVTFLRAALGSYAVARPTIDLNYAFTVLARAAGICGPTQFFSPFYSDYNFLLGAYIFEDVGVTAYLGAAGLITNKAYLTAAGGILGVEAYHAGAIRSFMINFLGVACGEMANKISMLRATLSQAPDDYGPEPSPGTIAINLAPTDANAVAFPRTTRQVLNVVYGGVNATSGLFFPDGMNGVITS
jgi:hypothetical protein